jgi:hypothetical protein
MPFFDCRLVEINLPKALKAVTHRSFSATNRQISGNEPFIADNEMRKHIVYNF